MIPLKSSSALDRSMRIFSAVLFYMLISIGLVFLNKHLFSAGFSLHNAVIFLTWLQVIVAVCACYIFSFLSNHFTLFSFWPQFEYKISIAKGIMPLTLIFCGMVGFNNLCLKYVQITFYQLARSLTILFQIIFTYLILGKPTSLYSSIACLIVISGYVLGIQGEVDFSVQGLVFGVMSSVFVALYSLYVKEKLSLVNGNEWLLLTYNNINAVIILPPIILFFGEISDISQAAVDWSTFVIIICTGITGFLINIASFLQIKITSPLTHNISGTVKACLTTLLAILFVGNQVNFVGGLGLFLVFGGSFLYGYIRFNEMEAQRAVQNMKSQEDIEQQPLVVIVDHEEVEGK